MKCGLDLFYIIFYIIRNKTKDLDPDFEGSKSFNSVEDQTFSTWTIC